MAPPTAPAYFACMQQACDWDTKKCAPLGGDLGDRRCATGCFTQVECPNALGHLQSVLRPEVTQVLAWCYTLGDCAEVRACEDGVLTEI